MLAGVNVKEGAVGGETVGMGLAFGEVTGGMTVAAMA